MQSLEVLVEPQARKDTWRAKVQKAEVIVQIKILEKLETANIDNESRSLQVFSQLIVDRLVVRILK